MKVIKRYEPPVSIVRRLFGGASLIRFYYLLECGHTTHGMADMHEPGADLACPHNCAVRRAAAVKKMSDRGMDK